MLTLYIGFIIHRQKFGLPEDQDNKVALAAAKAEAIEFAKKLQTRFPVRSQLDPKEWEWGELDEVGTAQRSTNDSVEIHYVNFVAPEERMEKAAMERKEMIFNGKVTEPV